MLHLNINKPNYISGISLLELLVCLTIISVVTIYSNSLISYLYQKNQIFVIESEIKSAIRFSRLEAIIRNEKLILSSIDDEGWSLGMKLYSVKTNTRHQNVNDNLIREWRWVSRGNTVTWSGFQSKKNLLFMPDINKSVINGTFSIDSGSSKGIFLVVNRIGRVYSKNK
ncbi:MAG: GspH/FimT family pseudopilin [Legionellaceae bacterium]|nr:GspH/FimT family pseudopilin [Legionellaceae bacterium]